MVDVLDYLVILWKVCLFESIRRFFKRSRAKKLLSINPFLVFTRVLYWLLLSQRNSENPRSIKNIYTHLSSYDLHSSHKNYNKSMRFSSLFLRSGSRSKSSASLPSLKLPVQIPNYLVSLFSVSFYVCICVSYSNITESKRKLFLLATIMKIRFTEPVWTKRTKRLERALKGRLCKIRLNFVKTF